jgi:hypothetical protein
MPFQLLYRLCLFVLRINRWIIVMLLLHQMCHFSWCTVCVCLTEDEQLEQWDATASANVLFHLLYRLCFFVLRMKRWSNVMLLFHQICFFSCCTVCVCLYWWWTVGTMWCYCFTKCAASDAVPSVFVCTEDGEMEQCDSSDSTNVLFQLLYRLCLFVLRMNGWSNVMLLLHQIWTGYKGPEAE